MALFKILRGPSDKFEATLSATVSPAFKDGYCYFLTGTNMFYVDYVEDGKNYRVPLNAENANTVSVFTTTADGALTGSKIPGYKVTTRLMASQQEIPTSDVVISALDEKMDKENPTGTGSISINRKASTTVGAKSVAMGNNPTASGSNSVSIGYSTKSSGARSTSFGNGTTASGVESTTFGKSTSASGDQSHAQNLGTVAQGVAQTAIGKYNSSDTTSLLIIGNGTDGNNRSNALTVDINGDVEISADATMSKPQNLITKQYLSDNMSRPRHMHQKCTNGADTFVFENVAYDRRRFLVYFNGLLLIEGEHYTVDAANSAIKLSGWTATADDFIQIVEFLPEGSSL